MQRLAKEKKLSSLEKPKVFVTCAELMSEKNDCVTPTFKTKRNMAAKLFKGKIDQMYEQVAEMEAAQRR